VSDRFRHASRASETYGQGVVELEEDDDPGQQAAALIKRVRGTFEAPTYAPPVLPVAALEVHQLSQAKNVKLEQVLSTLEKDPLLAARVLRVANSSLYAGAPLQSLHHAVMRLGMKNLASVVWEVALNMRVFRSKAYAEPMEQLRRHSVAVAHVARLVAQLTPIALDYAFLCGLLHDVGGAAVLLLLGERGNTDEALPADVLADVFSAAHADASQVVAKIWRLPDDLQLVLQHHHDVTIGGYSHPTAAVIALAERLVAEEGPTAGYPVAPWDFTPKSSLRAAEQALQINEASLEKLRKRTGELLGELSRMS
jgi:HD-like signal output (HDOD) protein